MECIENSTGKRVRALQVQRDTLHTVALQVRGRVETDEGGLPCVVAPDHGVISLGEWALLTEGLAISGGRVWDLSGIASDAEFKQGYTPA